MRRSLRVLLVGGLVAAGLSLPASPAHALCAGYMSGPGGEEHLGVWECDRCPQALYFFDGRVHAVVCFTGD